MEFFCWLAIFINEHHRIGHVINLVEPYLQSFMWVTVTRYPSDLFVCLFVYFEQNYCYWRLHSVNYQCPIWCTGIVQWLFTHTPTSTHLFCSLDLRGSSKSSLPQGRGQLFSVSLLSGNYFSPESFNGHAKQNSRSATFPISLCSLAYSYGWRVSRYSASLFVLLAFSFLTVSGSPFPAAYKQRVTRKQSSSSLLPVPLAEGKREGEKVWGHWECKRNVWLWPRTKQ